MDEYALRVGNLLAGNDEGEAALEITLLGPTIEFLAPGLIALTGADLGARLNGRECKPWASFLVSRGDLLQFTGPRSGCRAYLAAAGGFDLPAVLGSRSTYLRVGLGGLGGRALIEGDELRVKPANHRSLAVRELWAGYRKETAGPRVVRVVPGPQDSAFTPAGIST